MQILNDFVAVGYAVPPLEVPADVLVVNEGVRHERAPIAVLGPGTGLGETQLLWDSGAPPLPSPSTPLSTATEDTVATRGPFSPGHSGR